MGRARARGGHVAILWRGRAARAVERLGAGWYTLRARRRAPPASSLAVGTDRRRDMLHLTSQPRALLLLAAAALLGGGAFALMTGDARALGPLALGAVGGWCAAQALARRAPPATPPVDVEARQQPAAGPSIAGAPRAAANGHDAAA